MKKRALYMLCFLLISLLLIWGDAFSKQLAIQQLSGGREIVIIDRILTLMYLENRGAAFGILNGQQWLFYIITITVLLFIIYFIKRMPMSRRYLPMYLVCILIFSGAIGNFIDRIRQQYVVDFIYFKLIDFPVFNIADIYVSCGCFLMVLLLIFVYKDDELGGIFRRRADA